MKEPVCMPPFPPTILHATSTVADGNMSYQFDDATIVDHNRTTWLQHNAIAPHTVYEMHCQHGDAIHTITPDNQSEQQPLACDVLVTNLLNTPLLLLTADCIPTTVYDPTTATIALAHLNRRNAHLDVSQKLVTLLTETFGTNPRDLIVQCGPSITATSYCFPAPLSEPTPDALAPYCTEENERICVDVFAAHRAQLIATGITRSNIHHDPSDTATDPRYFSHYASAQLKSKPHGRFATLVMKRA